MTPSRVASPCRNMIGSTTQPIARHSERMPATHPRDPTGSPPPAPPRKHRQPHTNQETPTRPTISIHQDKTSPPIGCVFAYEASSVAGNDRVSSVAIARYPNTGSEAGRSRTISQTTDAPATNEYQPHATAQPADSPCTNTIGRSTHPTEAQIARARGTTKPPRSGSTIQPSLSQPHSIHAAALAATSHIQGVRNHPPQTTPPR